MKVATVIDILDIPEDLAGWMRRYIDLGRAGTPEEIILEALRLLQTKRDAIPLLIEKLEDVIAKQGVP